MFSLLATSISFDIRLFNGDSQRQVNANQFIDGIGQQLQQAIEVYEKTTLSKMMPISLMRFSVRISYEGIEFNLEARKALNLIETGKNVSCCTLEKIFKMKSLVIRMHTQFLNRCPQPIKDAIIRLFPYVRISFTRELIFKSISLAL